MIKSGLKFATSKYWLKNVSTFSVGYVDYIKTYDVKIPLSFKQKRQHNIHRGNNSKCFVVWFPIKNISKIHISRKISLYTSIHTIVKRISKPSRSIINRNLFTSNLTSNSTWHEKKLVEDVTNDYNYIT